MRAMQTRRSCMPSRDLREREKVLHRTLVDGAAWEMDPATSLILFTNAVYTGFKQKRLGARAVKQHELLDNPGETLTDEQRTQFRALAARANYLSLDLFRSDPTLGET